MVGCRSSRLNQNKPFPGPVSTLMSSSAEFYSFSLSGRLRAVGLNALVIYSHLYELCHRCAVLNNKPLKNKPFLILLKSSSPHLSTCLSVQLSLLPSVYHNSPPISTPPTDLKSEFNSTSHSSSLFLTLQLPYAIESVRFHNFLVHLVCLRCLFRLANSRQNRFPFQLRLNRANSRQTTSKSSNLHRNHFQNQARRTKNVRANSLTYPKSVSFVISTLQQPF